MDDETRQRAAHTAVDGFKVIERIYRHAYQTLIALKDEIKAELNLKFESPQYYQFQSASDPKSWIHHYKGLYLSRKKILLEDYKKKEHPILFLQTSLYNQNGKEPFLRYGIIEKLIITGTWKNARFDDYFKELLSELHFSQGAGEIKTLHSKGTIQYSKILLLDIREDSDIVTLAKEIISKYSNFIIS